MQILVRKNIVLDHCEEGYISTGTTVICPSKNLSFVDCNIVTVDSLPDDIDEYEYFYEFGILTRGSRARTNNVLAIATIVE